MDITQEKTDLEKAFESSDKKILVADDGTEITIVKEPIKVPSDKGGESTIYWGRVRDIDLIVKELFIPPYATPEEAALYEERFVKTSIAMANIEDPTLAGKVYGRYESNGKHYLLLYPYFKDDKALTSFNSLSLDKVFSQVSSYTMPKQEKFELIRQLSTIVLKMHHRGLYHMDLKLANLVYYDGFLKLIDFGLLVDRRKGISAEKRIPDPAFLAGTAEYTSPERLLLMDSPEDVKDLDFYASEIFSFALVVFKMLTKTSLFWDPNRDIRQTINSYMNFDLNRPDNSTAIDFNFKIDQLKDFTDKQKAKIKEALMLLIRPEPSERIPNFPEKFLSVLSEAFEDSDEQAA